MPSSLRQTIAFVLPLAGAACTPDIGSDLITGADLWSVSGSVEEPELFGTDVTATSDKGDVVRATVGSDGGFSLDLAGGQSWGIVLEGLLTSPLGITLEGLTTAPLAAVVASDTVGGHTQTLTLPGSSRTALARRRGTEAATVRTESIDLGVLSFADGWAIATASPLARIDRDRDGIADVDDIDDDGDGIPDQMTAPTLIRTFDRGLLITGAHPGLGMHQVQVSVPITLHFNDALDLDSLNADSVIVIDEHGTRIEGELYTSESSIRFLPTAPFASSTAFRAEASGDILTIAGTPLGHAVAVEFETMASDAASDEISDHVLSAMAPLHTETGVPTDFQPRVYLGELPEEVAFLKDHVTTTVTAPDGHIVPGQIVIEDNVGYYQHDEEFRPYTRYAWRITRNTDAKDPDAEIRFVETWFETGSGPAGDENRIATAAAD